MNDADIEILARTMCAKNGKDPDEKVADGNGAMVPRWLLIKQRQRSDIDASRDFHALGGFAPHMTIGR